MVKRQDEVKPDPVAPSSAEKPPAAEKPPDEQKPPAEGQIPKALAKALKAFKIKPSDLASHAFRKNDEGDDVVVLVTKGGRKVTFPTDVEAVAKRGGLTDEEKDGKVRSTKHLLTKAKGHIRDPRGEED